MQPVVRFPSTATAVVVPVRHAQDVEVDAREEFAVTVRAHVGGTAPSAVPFDSNIHAPSGCLTIGDADGEDTLDIGAGVWRLQIAVTPADHPEQVDVWLSRVDDT